MLRSRFFWKLYLSYSLLVLFTTAIIGSLVHFQLRTSLVSSLEASLTDKLLYLSGFGEDLLSLGRKSETSEKIRRLGQTVHSRITLVLPDGTVLADSHEDAAIMENHKHRPEIQNALDGGVGLSRRHSSTLDQDQLYLAQQVEVNGKSAGVIRVSIPLSVEQAQLDRMLQKILIGSGVAIMLAMLMGALMARKIMIPIHQMTEVANALRAGRYEHGVTSLPNDEIGILGDTFNRLGEELMGKIDHLSHQEAQLRAILTNLEEGVIAVDHQDVILFCNPTADQILGKEVEIRPGKKIWEFTKLHGVNELIQRAREELEAQRKELSIRVDNESLILNIRATPFKGNYGQGVILVLQDISNLRRLERVRQDFVANVSHELKTPLTSIKGYVETLQDGALSDPEHGTRFLGKVIDNVSQLTNLVQDLLDLGKIEADQNRLKQDSVNLHGVVKTVLEQHELEVAQKKLRCELAGETTGLEIKGDAEALHQIVDNLLSNAIRYTPDGGSVTVKIDKQGDKVCLVVSDTGIGIPTADLPRIFERFYRVDRARSRALGGTGLGLAIVKHLVQSMKGEVSVQSTEGKGTSFTVFIPLSSV